MVGALAIGGGAGGLVNLGHPEDKLGYAVTGDAITTSHQALSDRASARRASGAACAIDLHFFRRDRGAFTPADESCSLKPLAEFWESLSPQNRCIGASLTDRPRFERSA